MTKVILMIIFSIWNLIKVNAQNFPIKETYDAINSDAINYSENNLLDANGTHVNFERVSFILESYINQFKTTLDKGYLIKVVQLITNIQNLRGVFGYSDGNPVAYNTWDFRGVTDEGEIHIPYIGGLTIWPMAHYCHLVFIEHPELCSEPLPDDLINNLPSVTINTYGKFADWLVGRCVETLDYYVENYWINDLEGFREEGSVEFGGAINQQSAFASAFLYLGHLSNITPCVATSPGDFTYSGLQSYLDRAAILAGLYKSKISLYEDLFDCSSDEEGCFERDVLNLNTDNNSYWWYVAGWGFPKEEVPSFEQFESCTGENRVQCSYYYDFFGIGSNRRYIEDISHGFLTTIFPRVAFDISLSSGGVTFFTDSEMIRFRNSFAKNIWDGNISNPGFHNSMLGDGFDNFISDNNCGPKNNLDECEFNYHRWSALNWMPFYKWDAFDNTPEPLYNVVMKFYELNGLTNPSNLINGSRYLGLSELVAAQWDKECPNLNLYKRDLTYDQDFFSKNCLTIDPSAVSYASFAEPILTTNNFIIRDGVKSNITAANEITLKDGFIAEFGSDVTIAINPALCTSGTPPCLSLNNQPINANSTAQNIAPAPFVNPVLLSANSNELTATLTLTSPNREDKNQYFELLDLSGKSIINFSYLPQSISTQGISPGIYIARFSTENGMATKKVFIR